MKHIQEETGVKSTEGDGEQRAKRDTLMMVT